VACHDFLHNRETKAVATRTAGAAIVQARKGFEDIGSGIEGNAWAVIFYIYTH
tara:strand:- start:116 stop:274 length:159 start_codon:yes stop_codon:yes gene_type:complete